MRGGTGKRHSAFGHVARAHSHDKLAGVTVEAWDGDRFVARTKTAGDGSFRFDFGDHFLKALFGDEPYALTIKIAHHGKSLHEGKPWKAGDGEVAFEVDHEVPVAKAALLAASAAFDPNQKLKVKSAQHPLPRGTLGTMGHPVEVEGPDSFAETILRIPYSPELARGVETRGARVFRWDDAQKTLRPVWNSGVNPQVGFAWAKIRRPGVYVVLGLPSDKLLADALGAMAYQRRTTDLDTKEERERITRAALAPLVEPPIAAVEQLRQVVLKLESNTSIAPPMKDIKRGRAGSVRNMTLPGDASPNALRERLKGLETPPGGLPEENLFYPPELPGGDLPVGDAAGFKDDQLEAIEKLDMWKYTDLHLWWPWLFSHDWWMYQANERHSGQAAGWSNIRTTNVNTMVTLTPTAVAGPVYTKPAIVDGKIYVGTTETGTQGGTLYKIDLGTGAIDGQYETPRLAATYYTRGIGGSPAIVGGLAYFTSIHGRVYCIDTATMSNASPPPAALWITDLKHQDLPQNQPASNPSADSWSGPLVVNGNVYVGCGEGETPDACGMVYCLDAATGKVKWLFCTNQFTPGGADNQPNVVPSSLIHPGALPAGFTSHADPPVRGASVWSSLAFCAAHNRVYVGTGNPSPDSPAPNGKYSSGCISLDATTGQFKGMWSPQPSESYWPGDNDIDVPGGPIVYFEGGKWLVAIGSKSGACVVLDADTMAVLHRRQILPRRNGDGTPATPGTSLPSVVPTPPPGGTENHYGVYGTPARRGSTLFISMGSDGGIPATPDGLGDAHKTPFMRAVKDTDLTDHWPTTTDAFGVTRYTNAGPPMYTNGATGLGSAAVVNDVVFACTGLPSAIYAFDAVTGTPLWQDTPPSTDYCLGAAIYGDYVVLGAGTQVRRYMLQIIVWPWPIPKVPHVVASGFQPRSLSIPASGIDGGPIFGGGPVGPIAQIGAQVRR